LSRYSEFDILFAGKIPLETDIHDVVSIYDTKDDFVTAHKKDEPGFSI
jgi:hypothetical protein